jgi:hypothetical protein
MKARKYTAGGPVDPKGKSKALAASSTKSRAQEIEESKMIAKRESEDRAIAKDIIKDVASEVGPGAGRPSGNTGNVTLSSAKSQKITKDGVNYGRFKDGKPTRGELIGQFLGQKQQPVYRKGQTLGYAPEREVSSGAGLTMGKANLSSPKGGPVRSSPGSGVKPVRKPIDSNIALSEETMRKISKGYSPRNTNNKNN